METTFEQSSSADELEIKNLKDSLEQIMQITGTATSTDAINQLRWIKTMVNQRCEELKVTENRGLGRQTESLLHQYRKRESSHEEFKREAVSLIRGVEFFLRHGIVPENDPESARIESIVLTVEAVRKKLQQKELIGDIPF